MREIHGLTSLHLAFKYAFFRNIYIFFKKNCTRVSGGFCFFGMRVDVQKVKCILPQKKTNNHMKVRATLQLAFTHIAKDFQSVVLVLKCDKPVSVHKDNITRSVMLTVCSLETVNSPLGHSKAIQHDPHIFDGTILREDVQQFSLICLQGQRHLKYYVMSIC